MQLIYVVDNFAVSFSQRMSGFSLLVTYAFSTPRKRKNAGSSKSVHKRWFEIMDRFGRNKRSNTFDVGIPEAILRMPCIFQEYINLRNAWSYYQHFQRVYSLLGFRNSLALYKICSNFCLTHLRWRETRATQKC